MFYASIIEDFEEKISKKSIQFNKILKSCETFEQVSECSHIAKNLEYTIKNDADKIISEHKFFNIITIGTFKKVVYTMYHQIIKEMYDNITVKYDDIRTKRRYFVKSGLQNDKK